MLHVGLPAPPNTGVAGSTFIFNTGSFHIGRFNADGSGGGGGPDDGGSGGGGSGGGGGGRRPRSRSPRRLPVNSGQLAGVVEAARNLIFAAREPVAAAGEATAGDEGAAGVAADGDDD